MQNNIIMLIQTYPERIQHDLFHLPNYKHTRKVFKIFYWVDVGNRVNFKASINHFRLLGIYNHRLKSWDKFVLLSLLHTPQTRIQLRLPNLASHPTYNVENQYLEFHLIVNIVLGGEGDGRSRFLKG